MKHWRVGVLGLVVSLASVYFVVRQMDVSQLGIALQDARYIYVLPSALFVVLGLVARAFRWRVLLSDGLPLGRAFNILNISYLVNGILPLRIGEVARMYLASQGQPSVPVLKSASTIIVERLLDVLAVLVIAALALTGGPLPPEVRSAALFFAPLAVAGFFMLVFLASQRALALRLLRAAQARISLLKRFDLVTWLNNFLDGLSPLTKPTALRNAVAWTAISWMFSLASGYVLMFAFFDQASWAATNLFTAAASFAVAVPAVPGNLGTYELSILLALGAMGYGEPASTATAFALVVHGVNLGINAILGVYGFVQEGITLEQLSQGVRGVQQNT
ncbi:MAG: lysylphosphatidylglycerol synthase transmembrane domain-containing protein [Aggregatilineales bacterium]